jgi:DedD protein
MERRFKERLIGAIILVALVVLLVPEILSGPHHGATLPTPDPEPRLRSYTVDVAHIATAPPAPEPSRATSPAPEPAPVPIAPSAPVAAPVPAPPSPVVRSPAATAWWTVQLGNFASKAHAESFVRQLKSEGFSAYIAPIGAGGAQRYRVRLGPIADRSTAAGIMAKLQAHRHASTLLAPSQ